jgi:hypothetical protein
MNGGQVIAPCVSNARQSVAGDSRKKPVGFRAKEDTVATFERFPTWLLSNNASYVAADALIVTAAMDDGLTTHRVHSVCRYGLPSLGLG